MVVSTVSCAGALAGLCHQKDPRGRRKRGVLPGNGKKEAKVRVMKQRTSAKDTIKEGREEGVSAGGGGGVVPCCVAWCVFAVIIVTIAR